MNFKAPEWKTLDDLLLEMAEILVRERRPITVDTRGWDGGTALHVAAVWNDVKAIETLLNAGADIDAGGDKGCTPLHDAVIQGNYEAAAALVSRGASLTILDEFCQTPLDHAEMRNDQRFIVLLKSGSSSSLQ